MKTTLKLIIGSLVLSSAALAGPAPDFVGAAPRPHIDPSLVASSGTRPIDPGDIVQFTHNSALLSVSGFDQVDKAALWLKVHPRDTIVVEGHADHIGADGYNDSLSMIRAESVRKRLLQKGVSKDRIVMVARGEHDDDVTMNFADRRVRMFTTKMSRQAIIAMYQPKPVKATQTAIR